jgi:indole-3-glycerol phosphate synthase
MNRLTTLYQAKALATAADMAREPLEFLLPLALKSRHERRSFHQALTHSDRIGIIAEIKRASPSVGIIAENFDPALIAARYQLAGVDAMSVLTEASGFHGDIAYLQIARTHSTKPILRKDFLTSPYEIIQAAAYGADAVLLIVAGLTDDQLRKLLDEAKRFDLDALVEVHSASEITRALSVGASIIGINNRDLRNFQVDLATTEQLASTIPSSCCVVTESGIQNVQDIQRALNAGAHAALIGEAAMRSSDLTKFIAELHQPTPNAS